MAGSQCPIRTGAWRLTSHHRIITIPNNVNNHGRHHDHHAHFHNHHHHHTSIYPTHGHHQQSWLPPIPWPPCPLPWRPSSPSTHCTLLHQGQFQVNEIQEKNTSTQRLKVRLREAKISQDKLYFLQFSSIKRLLKFSLKYSVWEGLFRAVLNLESENDFDSLIAFNLFYL